MIEVTGWRNPSTVVNDALSGVDAWTNPGNATVSDDVRATCNFSSGAARQSQWLKSSGYGFTIPADARIAGIEVRHERRQSGGKVVTDYQTALVMGGTIDTTTINNAGLRAEEWATSDEVAGVGGSGSLWGVPLTPAIVNNSGFGYALRALKVVSGVGGVGEIDAMQMRVFYERDGLEHGLTVVKIRQPRPPFAEIATIFPESLVWGRALMRSATASFVVSRADPNLQRIPDAFDIGYAITVERPDGLHPFFGFISQIPQARRSDSGVQFIASDMAWLMGRARTRKSGSFAGASGSLIASVFREADSRAEPPTMLKLSGVEGGPGIEYEYQLQKLDAFMRQMADFTGWEWDVELEIESRGVVPTLIWTGAVGEDHRDKWVWEENQQLLDVGYSRDANAYFAATVVVGGSGSMAIRPAAIISRTGTTQDVNTQARSIEIDRHPALSGTRILMDRQVSNRDALFAAAKRLHDTPFYVGRQISARIVEANTNMDFRLGDIITIRLEDTFLGLPQEFAARILGARFDGTTLEHDIELQVIE